MNKAFALIDSLSLWLPRASGSIYVQVGHARVKFLIHCTYNTFAHSIFEGSHSKEGFHGTHGTPYGSATAFIFVTDDAPYVRALLIESKSACVILTNSAGPPRMVDSAQISALRV